MQANMRKSSPLRSLALGLAWLLAPIALCSGTPADAQLAPGPLCCDSATGTCAPLALDAGAPAQKTNSLGVQPRCPPPSANGVMIEIPGAGATKNATLRIQTSEPPSGQGFVGACLAPYLSYTPALPSVCYWVKVAGTVTGVTPVAPHNFAMVTASAAAPPAGVFQSYTTSDTTPATANFDSYQVLMTCYPHNADGTCSPPTSSPQSWPKPQAVSRSCCDLGGHMTSLDGKYATGFASMPTFP